jgi:phage shock protein PspC (stress-responsive transcriptional regulator)
MNTTATNQAATDDTATDDTATGHTATGHTASNAQAGQHDQPQPLCRPIEDRMLAGVASGIARYLRIDVTVVRIVFAVLVVVGGAGLPLYLAGWLLIPEEGAEQSIASQFIQSRSARSR